MHTFNFFFTFSGAWRNREFTAASYSACVAEEWILQQATEKRLSVNPAVLNLF